MQKKRLWISLFISILFCLCLQITGSLWTKEAVSIWYPTLIKPSWTPPNFVFAPVWTCLYILIAISFWLIYKAKNRQKKSITLIFFGIQLALNFIWSFLFFSLRNPFFGLIDILLLCLFLILTIIKSWSVRPLASLLLTPYLIWIIYAASLNIGICILNKPFVKI